MFLAAQPRSHPAPLYLALTLSLTFGVIRVRPPNLTEVSAGNYLQLEAATAGNQLLISPSAFYFLYKKPRK